MSWVSSRPVVSPPQKTLTASPTGCSQRLPCSRCRSSAARRLRRMAPRHARKRAKCHDQTIDPIVGSTEQMVVHSTVGQLHSRYGVRDANRLEIRIKCKSFSSLSTDAARRAQQGSDDGAPLPSPHRRHHLMVMRTSGSLICAPGSTGVRIHHARF